MFIKIKQGATLSHINPHFILASKIIHNVFATFGVVPLLTSGNDGDHGANSYHPLGYAWDWRTHDFEEPRLVEIAVAEQLHRFSPYYDVVYHMGSSGAYHLHTEYDVRRVIRDGVIDPVYNIIQNHTLNGGQ